ncbi:MAG: UPF0164 family protein [Elusimicrobiota bacterium]
MSIKIYYFRIIVVCFCGVLSVAPLCAIFESTPIQGRVQGLCGAFTGLANDNSAIYYNPAGLVQIKAMQISSGYTELFGLSDLKNVSFNSSAPLPKGYGVGGVSYLEFGSDIHKETTLTLSHGFNLLQDFYAGYNLNMYSLVFSGYGSATTLGVDLGIMARMKRVMKDFRVGIFARNLNIPKVGKEFPKNLPQELTVGVSYQAYKGAVGIVDVTKEVLSNKTMWKLGFEFEVAKGLILRSGAQDVPQRISVGFGVGLGPISFDYALYNHAILPTTHLVSFGYKFSQKAGK